VLVLALTFTLTPHELEGACSDALAVRYFKCLLVLVSSRLETGPGMQQHIVIISNFSQCRVQPQGTVLSRDVPSVLVVFARLAAD
jgi:hypothetical protein